MVRLLRGYIEDGFSDLGDFRSAMAYPVAEAGGAEIVLQIRGKDFVFYIEPPSDTDMAKVHGILACTDNAHRGRDKVRGPIDPTTWVQISRFVRERLSADVV
jgi:hypothetical protein